MSQVWSKNGPSNEDVWDDTELIKMYEESVNSTFKVSKSTPSTEQEFTTPEGKKYIWKIGQKCMAPFEEEEGVEIEWYPAVIEAFKGHNNHQVVVIFDGYGNQETVDIKDLWDENECEDEEDGSRDVVMESPSRSEVSSTRKTGKKSKNQRQQQQQHPTVSRGPQLPVLAPPPPPGVLSMVPPDEVEALSSMLMSWYMSGYHTGYYQALSDNKNKSKSSKK